MTELRSYPQFVKDNFKLNHFTKYDLDAAQCLGMIIFILNHLLASIIERKSTGRISQKSADLIQLMDLSVFKRLNFVEMYILSKRLHWLTSETSENKMAFFIKLRPCRIPTIEQFIETENSLEASKVSQTLSYLESTIKDPQENSIKREYMINYLSIRAFVTVGNVELAVNNFCKFVILSQMYKSCEPETGHKNFRIKAEETRLLASRVYKGVDGTFYQINLQMHINMGVNLAYLEDR